MTRTLMALGTSLVAVALGAAPVGAQAPLVCVEAADALETAVSVEREVAGAPAMVSAKLKEGRAAQIAALSARVEPGGSRVQLAIPLTGTVSTAALTLPAQEGRVTVVIEWTQGFEPAIAAACLGEERYPVDLGPSGAQLTRYLGRIGRAQTVWNARRRSVDAVFDRLGDSPSGSTVKAVFASVRAAAAGELADLGGIRRRSARYSALVRSAPTPQSLTPENAGLARSAARYDANLIAFLRALRSADSVSDIEAARRTLEGRSDRDNELRSSWRRKVTAVLETAGVPRPPWVARIGT